MRLLYADLPEHPGDPDPRDRQRLEIIVGVVAAVGAGLAGITMASEVLRSRDRRDREWATPAEAGPDVGFQGVERAVGLPTVAPTLVGPVVEVEFGPVDAGDGASTLVDVVPDPAPLPSTGADPRPVSPGSRPIDLTPITVVDATTDSPVATTSPTTAPDSAAATVPPTTTVPSTTAPSTTVPSTTVPSTTVPAATEPLAEIRQLALSAGLTITDQMAETLAATGIEGWVDSQLDPEAVPDQRVDEAIVGFELLDTDPSLLASGGLGPAALSQIRWANFVRMLVGERQIQEQVVSIWRELFAVHADPVDLVDLEQTIRRGALGPYPTLLGAVMTSAAVSRAHGVSESPVEEDFVASGLARALLELFTIGDREPIDDTDVEELADRLSSAGESFGEVVAELCLRHETSHNVARMLGVHFLGPDAPGSVIEEAASVYRDTSGNIGAVARSVLMGAVGHGISDRTRRGDHWLIAAFRTLGVTIVVGGEWNPRDDLSVAGMLRGVGAEPGTGFGVDDADWETPAAIQARWVIARRLVGSGGAGVLVDLAGLSPDSPLLAVDLIDELTIRLGVVITEGERDALLAYLGLEHDDLILELDRESVLDLVALIISFPTFQRRDGGRL